MRSKLIIVTLFLAMSVFSKEGIASYYHDKHHGNKTASGIIYDRNSFVCAHKDLPFGTKLLVTNLSNNKKVIVTVVDRGPFIRGREIDLSFAAADSLGMIEKGVQKVDYKIIK